MIHKSSSKRTAILAVVLIVVIAAIVLTATPSGNANSSIHKLLDKTVVAAAGSRRFPLARMLRNVDPKTVESKVQLPGGHPLGRAFFFKHVSDQRCCLNNGFFTLTGYILKACNLADKPNDVVILPPDLDSNGAFLTTFKLFGPRDIENLQTIAQETMGCTIVHDSNQIDGTRVEVPLASMSMNSPVSHWFYRSLNLPTHLTNTWNICYGNFLKNDDYISVHMRIEQDWTEFVSGRDDIHAFSPTQIAEALSNVPDDAPHKVISIHGDPDPVWAYGTGESPSEVWRKFNPKHDFIHKSRINPACDRELKKLAYNDVAMLDLWVAINSKIFVGHLGSSFSAAATQARHQRDASNEDYVYSCPELGKLMRRWDGGQMIGHSDLCKLSTTRFG